MLGPNEHDKEGKKAFDEEIKRLKDEAAKTGATEINTSWGVMKIEPETKKTGK